VYNSVPNDAQSALPVCDSVHNEARLLLRDVGEWHNDARLLLRDVGRMYTTLRILLSSLGETGLKGERNPVQRGVLYKECYSRTGRRREINVRKCSNPA